ncbi:MAG: FKBP-type peptidyl-prolyl cis-trans isomerase [Alistipes sp.]|nr:FKBP-type peptidyl-prolyl cis-trans isomerase [Alistipes sp.]MDE7130142.1 FKBP-type peptidyl-prolyl cis-trans isomerase [Alistipes sp.]
MKKLFYLLTVAAALSMSMAACGNKSKSDYCQTGSQSEIIYDADAQLDTLSYAIGSDIGLSLHLNLTGIDFDIAVLKDGVRDQIDGKAAVSGEDAENYINEFLRNKYQAYRMAQYRQDKVAETGEAEEEVELPELFDEEYTRNDVSYRFGVNVADNLVKTGAPVNLYWFLQAIDDSQNATIDTIDETLAITREQLMGALMHYYQEEIPARNAELSEKWLQEVAAKGDVKKTESGLLYRINNPGSKKFAADSLSRDVVRVKYEGKTRTGKIFDSSYQHAQEIRDMIAELDKNEDMTPEQKANRKNMLEQQLERTEIIEFPLNGVIPGWTEGMKLVGEGGSITLWIPANLAYGPRGAGRDIGPNEALVFNVELVEVKPYEAPKPVQAVEDVEE